MPSNQLTYKSNAKTLVALKISLTGLYKTLKDAQEKYLIALQEEIKCVFNQEDNARVEIAQIDRRRSFERLTAIYLFILARRKLISDYEKGTLM